jgi:hypothetical protein
MELFEKYLEEIKEDVRFDQINILEKQLMLPAVKHKWISYLIKNKIAKNNLEKKRKEVKELTLKKLTDENLIPTGIPAASLKSKVDSSESIKKIDEEIKDLGLIIEYLEKVEKILSSITYDMGNATKLMILETT